MAYARINCIPPEELPTKALLDEYRELPRVIKLVRAAAARGESVEHPSTKAAVKAGFIAYGDGVGHLRFFYPKCQYLFDRQVKIIAALRERGYVNLKVANGYLTGIPQEFYGDWKPSFDDMKANKQRLQERLNG